ncbi:hypothetical protein J2Z83_002867 [Virgibacillus natechei]|uniref:Transposase n=1 Tax=Virgibacillus natechei TaxID=1216297 RepID=A0ABS4IK63_9BACI|nr:hypothetical protein [Virgibacillus natechei]
MERDAKSIMLASLLYVKNIMNEMNKKHVKNELHFILKTFT